MNSSAKDTPGPLRALQAVFKSVPALLLSGLDLAILELQLLRTYLIQIAVLALIAIVTAIVAWLSVCSALAHALLIWLDLHVLGRSLVIFVLNAMIVGWAVHRIGRCIQAVGLPATGRQLRAALAASQDQSAPDAAAAAAMELSVKQRDSS